MHLRGNAPHLLVEPAGNVDAGSGEGLGLAWVMTRYAWVEVDVPTSCRRAKTCLAVPTREDRIDTRDAWATVLAWALLYPVSVGWRVGMRDSHVLPLSVDGSNAAYLQMLNVRCERQQC